MKSLLWLRVGSIVVLGLASTALGIAHCRSAAGPRPDERALPEPLSADAAPGRAVAPNRRSGPPTDSRVTRTWSMPLVVRDRHHVDLSELMPPAVRVATELQPGAKFFRASSTGFHRGTIDLDHRDPSDRISFDFNFGRHDPALPPGRDLVQVRVEVTLSDTAEELVARASPGLLLTHLGGELNPTPGCSAERAFEVAIGSGVPENAVARVTYDTWAFGAGYPKVWSFRVEGHDEYGRAIDAETCVIVDDRSAATRRKNAR